MKFMESKNLRLAFDNHNKLHDAKISHELHGSVSISF